MPETTDPTFYRTPGEAIVAPPERLAYVAAFDPAGKAKDAMVVLDCDPSSADYGRVVGWSELPTAGNELHHFGWNACSSALCHHGHNGHGQPLERRYLIVPGLRSSRTYILDTKPDPRNPHRRPRHRGRGAGRQGRLLPPAYRPLRTRRHLYVLARPEFPPVRPA
jgi:selenium-binding protein 1